MRKISFDKGWSFSVKGSGAHIPVTLPHDAMFSEKREEDNPSGKNGAYFAGNVYEYIKIFTPDAEWKDKKLILEFEGVYRNSEVYLNGEKLSFRPYGYTNFYVDITENVSFGKQNELKVYADNSAQPNSRWYSGAGIYRDVWLYVLPEKHIKINGVGFSVKDHEKREFSLTAETVGNGKVSAEITDGKTVLWSAFALSDGKAEFSGKAETAELWSAENPKLYTLTIKFGDDCESIKIGFRTLKWSASEGLLINGKRTILLGACIHHDNGPIGAEAHPFAERRKIRLLKKAGYNAVRSAHNPCSKALLDACDELGMYVLDEYADMWYIHKEKYDYADYHGDWWEKDLKDMIDKDYNHPSVVMYSIGNEVAETCEPRGIRLTEEMTEFIHGKDGTRPVTCGINIFFNFLYSMGMGQYSDKKADKNAAKARKKKKRKAVGSEFFNNLAGLLGAKFMKFGATLRGSDRKTRDAFAKLDVAGYNYGINRYKKDVKKYPDRIIVGSETFCSDAYRFYEFAKTHPALIGDFVWAGMDYIGEAGVGSWVYEDHAPEFGGGVGWLTAGSGRIDLLGNELGEASYTRVAFGIDKIGLAAVPAHYYGRKHSPSAWKHTDAIESWSYGGCEGNVTKAEVYARAYRAELYLNGVKVGNKKFKNDCRAVFKVKYREGELTAVAYDRDEKEIARRSLVSAGDETRLSAVSEDPTISADGLAYVHLRYTDGNGTLKPLARGRISVKTEGGELIGLGHACPYNPDGFLGDDTDTYLGEAMAVIRPSGSGKIKVTAESVYGKAETEITVK